MLAAALTPEAMHAHFCMITGQTFRPARRTKRNETTLGGGEESGNSQVEEGKG
jgi:hypothetical protein